MVAIKFLLLTTLLALGEASAIEDKKKPKKPTKHQLELIKDKLETHLLSTAPTLKKKKDGTLGSLKLSSNDGDGYGHKCSTDEYDPDKDTPPKFCSNTIQGYEFKFPRCVDYTVCNVYYQCVPTCAVTCNTKEDGTGYVETDPYGAVRYKTCENCTIYGYICPTTQNEMFKRMSPAVWVA